eukprot:7375010-Alexandrium_andersonii.AAC.1
MEFGSTRSRPIESSRSKAACQDTKARIWSATTSETRRVLQGHEGRRPRGDLLTRGPAGPDGLWREARERDLVYAAP